MGTFAAALAVAAVLTGCSSPSTAAPAPSSAPTSTPTQPPPTAAVQVPTVKADLSNQVANTVPPVRVQVGALGIDMPIEPVGLADDGSMGLPADTAVAAWYRYGPAPASSEGATVIAAHVDSLVYDIGPFAQLANAAAGTEVVVTSADGVARRYAIESTQSLPKGEVPWASVFDRSGAPRLTLVTCGGDFDYDRRTYLSNVIVTAVPIG